MVGVLQSLPPLWGWATEKQGRELYLGARNFRWCLQQRASGLRKSLLCLHFVFLLPLALGTDVNELTVIN